jgi:hypothetical protein
MPDPGLTANLDGGGPQRPGAVLRGALVYSTMSTAVNADRIREFREQAATDRLVLQARQARRARREAAAAEAILRRRLWSRWRARRMAAAMTAQPVPADATPDQWASALSMAGAAERTDADDRQPVGGRAC